ncbi:hypothetical protein DRE_04414 [Drechslerella stenobrocha 248]|uniref:Acyltransferase 3 domain-containing protein n=1 Tax=Drechslerella stenobrocha 248 TaxID=1043628 RepID=W7I1W7_9PEZI|nr:hypothetical protein DRE_04414 [Drechslerella stenobrocha 248]
MTGSGRTQLDLEVAGRRYSQDTLLDSDGVSSTGATSPITANEKSYMHAPSSGWRSLLQSTLGNRIHNMALPPKAGLPAPGRLLKNALIFLIPSFLSPYSTLEFKKFRPNSTEWLDGLRGIAAFIVFIYHHVVAYTGEEHDYAWDPTRHAHVLQLPVVRLFFAGNAMVRVFFVISGFALSCKPAKLMRKPSGQAPLMKTIASSVFRRYLRLFLPCLGAFFMIHCWRYWGAFDWFEVRHQANANLLPGDIEKYPAKSPHGFFGQMQLMLAEFYVFALGSPILRQGYDFATDKHMWTIPVEYIQSMTLFLFLAMVSHLRRGFRVWVIAPTTYLFWNYHQRYDYPLFLTGYFLAELHAELESAAILPVSKPAGSSYAQLRFFNKSLKTIFWSFVAIVGLLLLSFPTRDGESTFGYRVLCHMMPGASYYTKRVAFQSYGASILCLAVLYLPRVQAYLSLPVFQYLGRVSFSLYLMHGAIIRTLGHRLVLEGWSNYAPEAYAGRMFVMVTVFLFAVFPLTMWLSDIFWRLVESPVTNFVRWTESLVMPSEPAPAAQVKVQ